MRMNLFVFVSVAAGFGGRESDRGRQTRGRQTLCSLLWYNHHVSTIINPYFCLLFSCLLIFSTIRMYRRIDRNPEPKRWCKSERHRQLLPMRRRPCSGGRRIRGWGTDHSQICSTVLVLRTLFVPGGSLWQCDRVRT